MTDEVELPYINERYSCDDLYIWRQEVLRLYKPVIDARNEQLKKHQ